MKNNNKTEDKEVLQKKAKKMKNKAKKAFRVIARRNKRQYVIVPGISYSGVPTVFRSPQIKIRKAKKSEE